VPRVVLAPAGILLADVGLWAVAHVGSSYAAHRLPRSRLARDGPLLRLRPFEDGGRLYERLAVRRWKDRLPEAGALFAGGMSKRALPESDEGGVARFVEETRRGELAHWWSLLGLPFFALWNPPAGVALMGLYGVAVNLPFIVVQRFNRGRAQRVMAARPARVERSSGSRRSRRDGGALRTSGRSMP
jgi:glycosyl-4,4'-diaponeurosporenoate acyltransferase